MVFVPDAYNKLLHTRKIGGRKCSSNISASPERALMDGARTESRVGLGQLDDAVAVLVDGVDETLDHGLGHRLRPAGHLRRPTTCRRSKSEWQTYQRQREGRLKFRATLRELHVGKPFWSLAYSEAMENSKPPEQFRRML